MVKNFGRGRTLSQIAVIRKQAIESSFHSTLKIVRHGVIVYVRYHTSATRKQPGRKHLLAALSASIPQTHKETL